METKQASKNAEKMGLNYITEDVKSSVFWNVTPCSWVEVHIDVSEEHTSSIFKVKEQAKQVAYKKWSAYHIFFLITCLAYSSTLKIEAVRSSETSVSFYRTTRRHILGDTIVHIFFSLAYSLATTRF
jgi:hypothetical protein